MQPCVAAVAYLLRGICIHNKSNNLYLILGLNYAYIFPGAGRVNHAPLWSRLSDGDIVFLARGQPGLAVRATELRGDGWGRDDEAASTLAGRWVIYDAVCFVYTCW